MLLYVYRIVKVSYKYIYMLRKQLFKTCLGKIYGRKGCHFKEKNIYSSSIWRVSIYYDSFLLIDLSELCPLQLSLCWYRKWRVLDC